jgi:hypothetical protein
MKFFDGEMPMPPELKDAYDILWWLAAKKMTDKQAWEAIHFLDTLYKQEEKKGEVSWDNMLDGVRDVLVKMGFRKEVEKFDSMRKKAKHGAKQGTGRL